jgi:hypothetical protein
VNAKGRLYDPKLGRFLQVDPLQTDLFNAQRWNSYSYGLNNPLRYTDPTGFDGDDEGAPALPGAPLDPMLDANGQIDPTQGMEWHCAGDGSCTGEIKPIPPAGGEVGTAQAGNPAEEALVGDHVAEVVGLLAAPVEEREHGQRALGPGRRVGAERRERLRRVRGHGLGFVRIGSGHGPHQGDLLVGGVGLGMQGRLDPGQDLPPRPGKIGQRAEGLQERAEVEPLDVEEEQIR